MNSMIKKKSTLALKIVHTIAPSALTHTGVAKLGHTGVRALATRGCAPPVQALLKIIGAECTLSIANWVLKMHKGVEIELRSIAISVPSE